MRIEKMTKRLRFARLLKEKDIPDDRHAELSALILDLFKSEITAREFQFQLDRLAQDTIDEIDAEEGLQINMFGC